MYAEPDADFHTGKDCFIYCGVNAHWEEHEMELPVLPKGMKWKIYADSADTKGKTPKISTGKIRLRPRSTVVLVGEK